MKGLCAVLTALLLAGCASTRPPSGSSEPTSEVTVESTWGLGSYHNLEIKAELGGMPLPFFAEFDFTSSEPPVPFSGVVLERDAEGFYSGSDASLAHNCSDGNLTIKIYEASPQFVGDWGYIPKDVWIKYIRFDNPHPVRGKLIGEEHLVLEGFENYHTITFNSLE